MARRMGSDRVLSRRISHIIAPIAFGRGMEWRAVMFRPELRAGKMEGEKLVKSQAVQQRIAEQVAVQAGPIPPVRTTGVGVALLESNEHEMGATVHTTSLCARGGVAAEASDCDGRGSPEQQKEDRIGEVRRSKVVLVEDVMIDSAMADSVAAAGGLSLLGNNAQVMGAAHGTFQPVLYAKGEDIAGQLEARVNGEADESHEEEQVEILVVAGNLSSRSIASSEIGGVECDDLCAEELGAAVGEEEMVAAELCAGNLSPRGEVGAVPRDIGSLVVDIFNLDPIIQQVQEKVHGDEGGKMISKRRGIGFGQ
nr:uncharacterized protein LOC113703061 isoform X2 [Coffea arabica]